MVFPTSGVSQKSILYKSEISPEQRAVALALHEPDAMSDFAIGGKARERGDPLRQLAREIVTDLRSGRSPIQQKSSIRSVVDRSLAPLLPLRRPQLQQHSFTRGASDLRPDSTSLALQSLGMAPRPSYDIHGSASGVSSSVAARWGQMPPPPTPTHWESLQNQWHDVSSKISALSGKEKQTQEAWQELLKHPHAQELKRQVEDCFQQSITITTVSRDEAFFGCKFAYEMTPSGKQVKPAIKIANDLDRDGTVRCLLAELTNLSATSEFSTLVRGAMDHSLSRDEFVQKMETLELDIQRQIFDPIEKDLESQGVIKPAVSVYVTDPDLPLTDRLRDLRDRHNEGYGRQWDRLNPHSASASPSIREDHFDGLKFTGNQLLDDVLQGAFAHQIEHRVGKRPTLAIEVVSEAVRKGAHSEQNPIRDRIVSAGVEIGMLSAAGAATGVPGFFVMPGAHLLADGAAALEKTTREFMQTRSPEEFALDGGGEYPNMYDMAVVGYVGSKLAQVPSKGIHAVHHKIAHTIEQGLDQIGLTDANIARGVNAVIEAGIAAAKMDYSLIASAEAAEFGPP